MDINEVAQKWERVSQTAGEQVKMISVCARIGSTEVDFIAPRGSLPLVRRDIISVGGWFRAVFI